MENRPEYLFAWIGLAKIGAVTSLINTNLSGAPLVHAFTVCGAKTFIIGGEMLAAYEAEEREDSVDPEYARLAGALPFVDGTLEYTVYAPVDHE